MDDNRTNLSKHGGSPWWRTGLGASRRLVAEGFAKSHKWRWMVPWTLAAMGVAVTIAWVLQPPPQPQVRGPFGPGGYGGYGPGGGGRGGARAGGQAGQPAQPNAQQTAQQTAPAAGSPMAPGGGGRGQRGGQTDGQGTAVGAAIARAGDIDVTLNALGNVTPAAIVTIKPQIGGQLQQVAFKEGQLVQKGDFIAQIDPRNYEIQLRNAQANLQRDKVLLENAKRDLARYEALIAENATSQQQVETQRAAVGQYDAAVATDQAQINTATLNLTYCHILAPITGRIGLRQVDEGNYVTAGDANGLGVIAQVSPITVVFPVPEDNLPQIQKRIHDGADLVVSAFDRNGAINLATGKLDAIDNVIDPSTGTVRIKALFENRDGALFPNQFVNIRLLVDTVHNVTVLPPAAVQHGAPGAFVYLIKADNTVTIQPVKTGVSTAALVQIITGVNPGDEVVIDGVDRLRENAAVYVPNPPVEPFATPSGATPDPAATSRRMRQGGAEGGRRRGGAAPDATGAE